VVDGRTITRTEDGLTTSVSLSIKHDRLSYVQITAGKGKAIGAEVKYTFKINPDRNPNEIELLQTEGEGKGLTLSGVYALKGDSLTMALSGEKLKEFPDKPGRGQWLLVLKRVKD
jgi:uncharacterized protein (TIGR03067 family)